jgi:LysR family hydrogen peroxide-inducible transcriptional activator
LKPNVVFESGQFATILAMVSAGMGISAVPEMAVQTLEGCRYLPIQSHGFSRRIGAVMMRQHFETRAQQAFLQHLSRTYSTARSSVTA